MTRAWLRHPFLRPVPLLLLVAAGALLWRSSVFPQPRTLVWDVPASEAVARAEVELWQGTTLVARVEWPAPPHGALVQRLQLRSGSYRALTRVGLADGRIERHEQTLSLGTEETVHLDLLSR